MSSLTITFTFGSTILSLPTPDYPEEPGDALKQTISGTLGGRITSVTFSDGTVESPVLHFTHLTTAEKDALVSFINVTVVGATNEFTFTDWNSVSFTVKYIGGLPARSSVLNSWYVDLALRVVA